SWPARSLACSAPGSGRCGTTAFDAFKRPDGQGTSWRHRLPVAHPALTSVNLEGAPMNHAVAKPVMQGGLIALLVCVGCGPTLQVRTDFDHTVSFSRYQTFALG